MLVDDHESVPLLELDRSSHPDTQKRRLQPSLFPVITDFFVRAPHEKKKKPRKQRIVPPEKLNRLKRALGKLGATGTVLCRRALFVFF